jgi:hypothetical protein
MRKRLFIGVLGLAVLAALAVVLLPVTHSDAASAGSVRLRAEGSQLGITSMSAAGLPPNCANWHELWPSYCTMHHQDAYGDNGDGVISPCDNITLDGTSYHVDWVGPTYFIRVYTISDTFEVAVEPAGSHNPGNPVCETWHVVWSELPVYNPCDNVHVDGWTDHDGSGSLSNGDIVVINTVVVEIVDIGLNIITTPGQNLDIPTLSEWGILALLLVLVGIGALFIRRRYTSARA